VGTAAPVDPRRFIATFIAELNRRHRPIYPETLWWKALQIADLRDRLRFVAQINSIDDDSYFERQKDFLLRESDLWIKFQTPAPRMAENPAPWASRKTAAGE
jgi:hypothetical protein